MKKYGCTIKENGKYKLCPDVVLANDLNEAGKVFEEDYVVGSVFIYKDNSKYDVDEEDGSIILH